MASASIHAACAVSIGLRGKATAMPVPSPRCVVASAAAEHIENTGRLLSGIHNRSKPAVSTRRLTAWASASDRAEPKADRTGN